MRLLVSVNPPTCCLSACVSSCSSVKVLLVASVSMPRPSPDAPARLFSFWFSASTCLDCAIMSNFSFLFLSSIFEIHLVFLSLFPCLAYMKHTLFKKCNMDSGKTTKSLSRIFSRHNKEGFRQPKQAIP